MMKLNWLIIIGLSGFTGVAAGAAAAHSIYDPSLAALVEKAALYQLIHTAVLVAVVEHPRMRWARYAFALGILLFSGSLYAKGFSFATAAPLAPAGGMLLMLGWLLLALGRKS